MGTNRFIWDKIATSLITIGGLSIIGFILLVFFYLFRQVVPLFAPASIQPLWQQKLSPFQDVIFVDINEHNDLLIRLQREGQLSFYDGRRSLDLETYRFPVEDIVTFSTDAPNRQLLFLADNGGNVLAAGYKFVDVFDSGSRITKPIVFYPLGEELIQISTSPLQLVTSLSDDSSTSIVGYDTAGRLNGKKIFKRENLITGAISRSEQIIDMPPIGFIPDFIQLFDRQRHLLVANKSGRALLISINNKGSTAYITQELDISTAKSVRDITIMLGSESLIIADEGDNIHQWFLTRGLQNDGQEGPFQLRNIRSFQLPESSVASKIVAARNSKSFLTITNDGRVLFINAPSSKQSINYKLANSAAEISSLAMSARSDGILVTEKNGMTTVFSVHNPHPDLSISRIFKKLWYEGYNKPDYTWQSTSGDNEFEPKYSLVPLTFGTLKAAVYAMVFSAPLAIAGAIYTAFFMGAGLRRKIKPIIEMMEAFPTVILGFIAGIIMAPYFEKHLSGILTIILCLPLAVLMFGLCFRWLRVNFKQLNKVSETIIIIPFLIVVSFLLLQISPLMELFFFEGDMRAWLNNNGIDYNQRNALVVGIAMGLAVIPTIYSIAEDAVFSVPRLMVNGAYALGATPMQNVVGIVLPASLGGILSALMIGFGRAVGETMIVLMATGNTPVMDASIFTGMRTLAANIAVELPEAPAGSSHFRLLFLCGLLLLVFTFCINTVAELIRHRIRKKYANL